MMNLKELLGTENITWVGSSLSQALIRMTTPSFGLHSVGASDLGSAHVHYQLVADVVKHSLVHMDGIQTNLQYWTAIAEGSDPTYRGVDFKSDEARPMLLVGQPAQFEPDPRHSQAPPEISSKVAILRSVRYHLSAFISKVLRELIFSREHMSLPDNLLAPHRTTLEGYISGLKDSFDSIVGMPHMAPFTVEIPMNGETPRDAVQRIYGNIYKMDMYLSTLVAKYRRPRKILQKWMPITIGAVVVAGFSIWIVTKSGPGDIMDSTISAFKDFMLNHFKEPLTGVKDKLFNKSSRDVEVLKTVEVGVNKKALNRILEDYIVSAKDQKYRAEPNRETLELLAERYAEQVQSPIRGIVRGDLVQNCLIQIHKLKLDVLIEMLSVHKILRENELSLAILSASPALGGLCVVGLVMYTLVRRVVTRSRSVGKLTRARLLNQIEMRLYELQHRDGDEDYWRGMLVYTLDVFYKVVESPAKATHEWESVKQEIRNMGRKVGDELDEILVRLKGNYVCLRE